MGEGACLGRDNLGEVSERKKYTIKATSFFRTWNRESIIGRVSRS